MSWDNAHFLVRLVAVKGHGSGTGVIDVRRFQTTQDTRLVIVGRLEDLKCDVVAVWEWVVASRADFDTVSWTSESLEIGASQTVDVTRNG
jgi:hypothetical protein